MSLPRQDNLIGDYRFYLRTLKDYSDNGNDLIPQSNKFFFANEVDGAGLSGKGVSNSSEALVIDSSSDYENLTEFTFFISVSGDALPLSRGLSSGQFLTVFSNWNPGVSGMRWAATVTFAGVAYYELDFTDTNGTNQYVWLSVPEGLEGQRTFAVTFKNNGSVKFYRDGVLYYDQNIAGISYQKNSLVPTFFSDYDRILNGICNSVAKTLSIWNKELTADDIAQVHEWAMLQESVIKPKKHFSYPSMISGDEDGLVAAWDFQNVHGKIIDKTGNGYDGTIYGAKDGKNGLQFDKNNTDYVSITTSPLSTHSDFSFEMIGTLEDTNCLMSNGNGNGVGVMLLHASSTQLQLQVKKTSDGTFRRAIVNVPENKELHIIGTYDASAQDLYLYIDGVGTQYSVTTASTDALGGNELRFGARNSDGAVPFSGAIRNCKIYNRVLTQAEVDARYREYARLPYFVDDLADASESVSANSADYLEDTNWKIQSGSWKISRNNFDNVTLGDDVIVDGDMEASGTSDWSAGNSATLTKETSNPHGGSQVLRVAYNGVNNPYAQQTILTVGRIYRITGWTRSTDGTAQPRIANGGTTLFTGTTSTDWQNFDIIFTATTTTLRLYGVVSASGVSSDFDDITIHEIDAKDKTIACSSTGILSQESKQAYGTFKLNAKFADTNQTLGFISTGKEITATGSNGYAIYYNASANTIQFAKIVNGGVSAYIGSAITVTPNVWHDIKITRRYDGLFTLYLDDAEKTSGTDNTYTTSNYISLYMATNSKVTNFNFNKGVI